MSELCLTRHANLRASQRGVTHDLLDALMAHADFEVRAGGGCTVLRCSRQRLRDRELRASLGPKADRLASLAVVMADESGEIVTVLHDHGRSSGRHYRRDHQMSDRRIDCSPVTLDMGHEVPASMTKGLTSDEDTT